MEIWWNKSDKVLNALVKVEKAAKKWEHWTIPSFQPPINPSTPRDEIHPPNVLFFRKGKKKVG